VRINLLCVGDVVGSPGRMVLSQALPAVIAERNIQCAVANAENAAGGSGLTPPLYHKVLSAGVDVITMGDHVYRRAAIIDVMQQSERIVRPANLAPQAPGRDFVVHQTRSGHPVAVFSLLGRMYMRISCDCPFRAADRVLAAIPSDVRTIIVDVHAEATSEKIALGWYLDGRVSVMFGTHTHVQTADECILPHGTAYITDLGMTGPYDSVLGRSKELVIRAMTTHVPAPFEVATGDPRMCGIVVEVDTTTGRAHAIERVCVRGRPSSPNGR
jgi:metallophosphoesterase (TIGR00282 family)